MLAKLANCAALVSFSIPSNDKKSEEHVFEMFIDASPNKNTEPAVCPCLAVQFNLTKHSVKQEML